MVEPLYSSEESTIFYYFSVKDKIVQSQLYPFCVVSDVSSFSFSSSGIINTPVA